MSETDTTLRESLTELFVTGDSAPELAMVWNLLVIATVTVVRFGPIEPTPGLGFATAGASIIGLVWLIILADVGWLPR